MRHELLQVLIKSFDNQGMDTYYFYSSSLYFSSNVFFKFYVITLEDEELVFWEVLNLN